MSILSVFKEGEFLNITLLIKKGKLYRIALLEEYSLHSFDILDLLLVIKNISEQTLNDLDVIAPLSNHAICIKKIELPFRGRNKVQRAIYFFSKKNFYIRSKELVVCPIIHKIHTGITSTLVATSTECLLDISSIYEDLNVPIDSITTISSALSAFVTSFCELDNPHVFVIHLGFKELHMVYVQDRSERHCFSHPIGLKEFIDVLIDNDCPPSKIDADLIKILIEDEIGKSENSSPLYNLIIKLQGAIERFIDSVQRDVGTIGVIQVLFTGCSFIIENGLSKYHIKSISTKPHIEYDSMTLKKQAIAIGSALQLTHSYKEKVLFKPVHLNKKTSLKMTSTLKSSLLYFTTITCIAAFYSSFMIIHTKKALRCAIERCAKDMGIFSHSFNNHTDRENIDKIQNYSHTLRKRRLSQNKIIQIGSIVSTLKGYPLDSLSYKLSNQGQIVTFKLSPNHKNLDALIKKVTSSYKNKNLHLEVNKNEIQYSISY